MKIYVNNEEVDARTLDRKVSLGEICLLHNSNKKCEVCLEKRLDRAMAVIALQSTIIECAYTEKVYKYMEYLYGSDL